jgi:hypothetical protein
MSVNDLPALDRKLQSQELHQTLLSARNKCEQETTLLRESVTNFRQMIEDIATVCCAHLYVLIFRRSYPRSFLAFA